jgi:hypothetical protein
MDSLQETRSIEIEPEQLVLKVGTLEVTNDGGIAGCMTRVLVDGKPFAVTRLSIEIDVHKPLKIVAEFYPMKTSG